MNTNKEHSANFNEHIETGYKVYGEDKPVEDFSNNRKKHNHQRDDEKDSFFLLK